MSVLVVLSSWMGPDALLQLPVATPLVFCWSKNPVEGDGQETTTEFVAVRVTAAR